MWPLDHHLLANNAHCKVTKTTALDPGICYGGGGGGGAVLPEGQQCMRSCLLFQRGGGGGGGGGAVRKLNEPIRHSHARILY